MAVVKSKLQNLLFHFRYCKFIELSLSISFGQYIHYEKDNDLFAVIQYYI